MSQGLECAGGMGSSESGRCTHPPRFKLINGTLIRHSCGWHLARFVDRMTIVGGQPVQVVKLS